MPLSTESVRNRPLTGAELIEVVLNDVREMLQRDGMFSPYIAYKRLAYNIEIKLQTGNPLHPEHTALVRSRATKDGVPEPYPLPLTVDIETGEKETVGEMDASRQRDIESPNLTRIHNKLPIRTYSQVEGKTVENSIHYEAGDYPPVKPPVDTQRGAK